MFGLVLEEFSKIGSPAQAQADGRYISSSNVMTGAPCCRRRTSSAIEAREKRLPYPNGHRATHRGNLSLDERAKRSVRLRRLDEFAILTRQSANLA
jgi:hypothetical protein